MCREKAVPTFFAFFVRAIPGITIASEDAEARHRKVFGDARRLVAGARGGSGGSGYWILVSFSEILPALTSSSFFFMAVTSAA